MSVISISTYCTGLQSLNLYYCDQLSDASIISISTHCAGLKELNLWGCRNITDAGIISLQIQASYQYLLQSLNLQGCC